eukprot:1156863-Pelagomonas_calceolata.AAC.1
MKGVLDPGQDGAHSADQQMLSALQWRQREGLRADQKRGHAFKSADMTKIRSCTVTNMLWLCVQCFLPKSTTTRGKDKEVHGSQGLDSQHESGVKQRSCLLFPRN